MEGTPFGRYQLIDLLGRGGMGEVWRAFDTAMNRVVALKVLPANLADDAQYQARFRREAQAAAGLDEPHIVPIHDFGEIDGRLYVTMRLIDGKTVEELLANGPLPPERAVSIIEQIARRPLRCPPRRARASRRQTIEHLGDRERLRVPH